MVGVLVCWLMVLCAFGRAKLPFAHFWLRQGRYLSIAAPAPGA